MVSMNKLVASIGGEQMETVYPDIYFLPEWGKFYETKEEQGKHAVFEVEHEWGHIFYQFIVRPVPVKMGGLTYYDIITPYGFSGPIILSGNPEKKQQLIELFKEKFGDYCEEHRIVTEYVRFSPWLKNRLDFKALYDFRDNGHVQSIDLTGEDFFMDQFASVSRGQVRKALKNNVEIEFDYTGEHVEEFHRLYMMTVTKNNIDPYYVFSVESLRKSFETFKGKQFFLFAKHEGRYISCSFILHHGDYVHYHLTANDLAYSSLSGNSLIVYEMCRWGVDHGKKEVQLGGAPDERLYRFKRNFNKTEPSELMMGKRIHNQAAYDGLVEAKKNTVGIEYPGYFPLYRG